MKVFEFDFGDGYVDWVAAHNTKEAKEHHSSFSGEHIDSYDSGVVILEYSDKRAKESYILDVNEPVGEGDPDYELGVSYKIIDTMYNVANELSSPEIIATTAF